MSLLRRAVGGAAKAMGASAGLTVASYQTGLLGWADEGSERSLRFWSAAFPVYLRYEFVQQRNKRGFLSDADAMVEYEALHNKYTDYVRDLTYEMRGFYLKNAQLMSTRDEFVPKQYLGWCKETQVRAVYVCVPCLAAAATRLCAGGDLPRSHAVSVSSVAVCVSHHGCVDRRTTARPSSKQARHAQRQRRSSADRSRKCLSAGTTPRWRSPPSARSTARGCGPRSWPRSPRPASRLSRLRWL